MPAEKPFSEFAFAPMCTYRGVSWFALSFIRHARRDAQDDFTKAVAGNGHGWRVLEGQGWQIARIKMVQQ